MHIVMACDKAYLPHVASVVLQFHMQGSADTFHILTSEPEDVAFDMQNQLRALHADLHFHCIHPKPLQMFQVRKKHLSKSTFLRLFAPLVLNSEGVQYALYLDADILLMDYEAMCKNVAECITRMKHFGVPFSAVEDGACTYLGKTPRIFNAGVLLMDVHMLETDNFLDRCKWIAEYCNLEEEDQSILNIYANSSGWITMHGDMNNQRIRNYADNEPLPDGICIKHFVGELKPWNYKSSTQKVANPFLLDKYMWFEDVAREVAGI